MILVDLNVVLDVVQKREPYFAASAAVLERIVLKEIEGAISAHAVTTIHYIVERYRDAPTANQAVDWLLHYFVVAPVGYRELSRARALGWRDFEDAVVVAAAEASGCDVIVTRNVKDFDKSPVSVVTPEEYLLSSIQ